MDYKILCIAKSREATIFKALGIDLIQLNNNDDVNEISNKVKEINFDDYALVIYQSNLHDELKALRDKYRNLTLPIFLSIQINENDPEKALEELSESITNTLGVTII